MSQKTISFIVPCYNESKNILPLYQELAKTIPKNYNFEVIYVNDGSTDNTASTIENIAKKYVNIILIDLSRNFGKEAAVSAGLSFAIGDAAMIIDADLQYPIDKIPDFINLWERGALHVIGLRKEKQTKSFIEKFGSQWFGKIMNLIGERNFNPRALDFRLIDRKILTEFNRLKENNRMVRSLLDWLNFDPVYIEYEEKPRLYGIAGYSFRKRFNLALNSFVYHSVAPLKLIFFCGLVITISSFTVGVFLAINYLLLNNSVIFVSGTFALSVFNTFLIGIVISCIGLLAFYIASIRTEVIGRPVYVIKKILNANKHL